MEERRLALGWLIACLVVLSADSVAMPATIRHQGVSLYLPPSYNVGKVLRADVDGDGRLDTVYLAVPPLLGIPDTAEDQSPNQKPAMVFIQRSNGKRWTLDLGRYYELPVFTTARVTKAHGTDLIFATQEPYGNLIHKNYYLIAYWRGSFRIIFDGSDRYWFDYLLVSGDSAGRYLLGLVFEGGDGDSAAFWRGEFYRWNGQRMCHYMTRTTNIRYDVRRDAIRALKSPVLSHRGSQR